MVTGVKMTESSSQLGNSGCRRHLSDGGQWQAVTYRHEGAVILAGRV